jgi:hypothetical protein
MEKKVLPGKEYSKNILICKKNIYKGRKGSTFISNEMDTDPEQKGKPFLDKPKKEIQYSQ